jgi:hypothetical protein
MSYGKVDERNAIAVALAKRARTHGGTKGTSGVRL